jgi:hypothetical protein
MQSIPTLLEQNIVSIYGPPLFLRYEIYPTVILTDDLRQTRYVVWAAIATPEQLQSAKEPDKEVGVFTNLLQFENQSMRHTLQDLISKTIYPHLEAEGPRELLNRFDTILRDRMVR